MQKVCWSEGLFLQPQHFQLQDNYHEQLIYYKTKILNKFCWGVLSLELNEEALNLGLFEIRRCEIMLRDGTPFRYQGNVPGNATIESRNFEQFLLGAGKPMAVFLGIKKEKTGEPNSSTSTEEAPKTRFILNEQESFDFNTGANPYRLDTLKLNGKLFFAGEEDRLENFDYVKIAEIMETGQSDRRFELSKSFIPPCLTISSNEILRTQARRISDILISKAKVLTQQLQNRGFSLTKFPINELIPLMMLHSINSTLPSIQHCVTDGGVHPFNFYSILGQIFGSLSTFSPDISSWEMQSYDHENLGPCYHETTEKICKLLELSVPTDFEQLQLSFDGEYHCTAVKAAHLEPTKRLFMAAKSSASPADTLHDTLAQTAKISSRENMEYIVSHALGGIPIVPVQEPPTEIPQRPGFAFFRLAEHDTQWDAVRRHMNIAIHFEAAPESYEIEIYILKV